MTWMDTLTSQIRLPDWARHLPPPHRHARLLQLARRNDHLGHHSRRSKPINNPIKLAPPKRHTRDIFHGPASQRATTPRLSRLLHAECPVNHHARRRRIRRLLARPQAAARLLAARRPALNLLPLAPIPV